MKIGDIVYCVHDFLNLVVKCEVRFIATKTDCPFHMKIGDAQLLVLTPGERYWWMMNEKPQFCFKTIEEAKAARDYARHRIEEVKRYNVYDDTF